MFSYLCVGLPSAPLFSIKLKSCIQVSCLTNASCLCLSHLHSLKLISYSLQSTNHEAAHYTLVSILLSLPPSWAQTFSAATSSILTVYVLSFGWKVILQSFGAGKKNSNWYDVTAARDTNLCTTRINSWVSQSHIMTMSCQCQCKWTDAEVEPKLMPNNYKLAHHFGLTDTKQRICTQKNGVLSNTVWETLLQLVPL